MALDPNDPMQQALYPVPQDLVWPPPEYAGLFSFTPEAQQPTPEQLALAEYGLPSTGAGIPGQVPPPPPPPPPPLRGVVGAPGGDELAAPIPAAEAAAAAPAVDAVSGATWFGNPTPQPQMSDLVSVQPELTGAKDPWEVYSNQTPTPGDDQQLSNALEQHARDPLTPEATLTPENRLDATLDTLNDRQLAEYGKRDPEGFGAYLTRKDEQKRIDIAERGQAIADRDREAQAENVRIRREGLKRADAAQAQAQFESDNMAADGGFWNSRTDGQKLLGLLSIGVGAFVAGPHGENKALAIWQRSQDQHIANAKRKLADKNSAISKMYARIGDDFLADETLRQATLKAEYASLASYEQLLAPGGTSARKSAQRRLAISADIAASEQKAREHGEKQYIEAQKFLLDVTKQKEAERNNRAQTASSNYGHSISAGRLAFDKADAKDKNQLERDKLIAKRDEDLAKLDRENAVGGVIGQDGKLSNLTQAGGKTTFHASPEEHKALVKARNGALNLLDTMSKLKTLRDKAGGANKFTSPSDKLEYERLANRAVIDYANATGASFSDEQSKNLVRDRLFGGDPSGYNVGDAIGRIDRSMDEVKRSYVNQLRTAKWTGEEKDALQFIDSYDLKDAPLTADEESFKLLFVDPNRMTSEQTGLSAPTEGTGHPAMIPAQKVTLDAIAREARIDPTARVDGKAPTAAQVAEATRRRDVAIERLSSVAREGTFRTSSEGAFGLGGGTPEGVRPYAQQLLNDLGSTPPSLGDPRGVQSGAKDTIDPRAQR